MKKGIGFKIIAMAVILSVIAAIIGCIGLFTTRTVSKLTNKMYEEDVLRIQSAKDIQIAILTARTVLLDANTVGRSKAQTEASKAQFQNGFTTFQDAVVRYEATGIDTAERKSLIQTVKDAGSEYAQKGLGMFDLIAQEDFLGADKYMNTVMVPIRVQKLQPAVDKLVSTQIEEAVASYASSKQISSFAVSFILGSIFTGLALSLFLAFSITRGITKPVTKIVNDLSDSSSQIGTSSTQLSSASQEIANGAQEQASSIEETTASMEELSSMVKQNLGNTRQASLLSEKATEASQSGYDKMNDMLTAMNGISKSAEDIKNVIDVIDDIAFQTNMLALNAAVEAARAGEAGMGFAVVADEVKNLANRSSESAKETAAMIKETLKNVDDGMNISRELSETFKDILANSKKVMEMNREVETASGQQDEGIGQVNKAMIQFDTVIQTNASSAEETASAAEELQSQVSSLNEIVETLFTIVSGKAYGGKSIKTISGEAHTVGASRGTVHAAAEIPARHELPLKKSALPASAAESSKKTEAKGKELPVTGHSISFEDDEEFKPV